MKLMAKLPKDDAGAKLMRFEGVRTQRYTEIFLIGGNVLKLVGAFYNTIGLNGANGNGDTCPQEILGPGRCRRPSKEYDAIGALKNGPRLWCLDWVEAKVGGERDLRGLKARWVTWLDVPKEMRKHERSPTRRSAASATRSSASTPARPPSSSTTRMATPGA